MGAMKAADSACCLEAPERNRYFHGQMLYERNFRLETDYHNAKRRLINRLVVGWGVVCGLALRVCEGEEPAIEIEPGVAIDRWGREIVVDCKSGPIALPPWLVRGKGKGNGAGPYGGGHTGGGEAGYGPGESHGGEPGYGRGEGYGTADEGYGGDRPDRPRPPGDVYGDRPDRPRPPGGGYGDEPGHRPPEDAYGGGGPYHPHHEDGIGVHVVLCYHECVAEPTAVLAGDCRDEEPCQPGLIRERWSIGFRPGILPPRKVKLAIPDVVSEDGRVDYEALVKAVSAPCPCPEDACIPLANLYLEIDRESGRCRCRRDVDLSVRPIVYTNDLLLQLILSAVIEAPSYRREK